MCHSSASVPCPDSRGKSAQRWHHLGATRHKGSLLFPPALTVNLPRPSQHLLKAFIITPTPLSRAASRHAPHNTSRSAVRPSVQMQHWALSLSLSLSLSHRAQLRLEKAADCATASSLPPSLPPTSPRTEEIREQCTDWIHVVSVHNQSDTQMFSFDFPSVVEKASGSIDFSKSKSNSSNSEVLHYSGRLQKKSKSILSAVKWLRWLIHLYELY